jgi:site-specific DNA-methyltransferase (adenine-specific)
MWSTRTHLPAGIVTLSAWGFEYKTVGFTWGKLYRNGRPYMGLGYWTQANAELWEIIKIRTERRNKWL